MSCCLHEMMLWLVNEEERNDEENFDGEKGVRGGKGGEERNVLFSWSSSSPWILVHVWGGEFWQKYVLYCLYFTWVYATWSNSPRLIHGLSRPQKLMRRRPCSFCSSFSCSFSWLLAPGSWLLLLASSCLLLLAQPIRHVSSLLLSKGFWETSSYGTGDPYLLERKFQGWKGGIAH